MRSASSASSWPSSRRRCSRAGRRFARPGRWRASRKACCVERQRQLRRLEKRDGASSRPPPPRSAPSRKRRSTPRSRRRATLPPRSRRTRRLSEQATPWSPAGRRARGAGRGAAAGRGRGAARGTAQCQAAVGRRLSAGRRSGARVTQEWGPTNFAMEPPYTYQGVYYPHFHGGIDMAVGCGTPILAAKAGVVVASGRPLWPYDPGYGVVIDHGGGIQTWYWHITTQIIVQPRPGGGHRPGHRLRGHDRLLDRLPPAFRHQHERRLGEPALPACPRFGVGRAGHTGRDGRTGRPIAPPGR